MNRLNTLGLLTLLVLAVLVGMTIFSPNANASRSFGFEQGDIASVDIFALIDRALSQDELTDERRRFEEESNTAMSGMQQQLMQLQTQLGSVQPNDPNAGQLYQQYQMVQNQLQTASQRASEQYQTLIAEQIAESYREIYGAVNEIAAQQGFVYVFATRSDGELLQTDTINGITQEILARPMVTPPASTDLTEKVREKLGYPEEIEVEATDITDTQMQPDPSAEQDAGQEDDADPADPMGDE